MSDTLRFVQHLAARGEYRASAHGYDELADDGIFFDELLATLADALVVEDYAAYAKGPCVPVLQRDSKDRPVHVLWGVPKGRPGPARP